MKHIQKAFIQLGCVWLGFVIVLSFTYLSINPRDWVVIQNLAFRALLSIGSIVYAIVNYYASISIEKRNRESQKQTAKTEKFIRLYYGHSASDELRSQTMDNIALRMEGRTVHIEKNEDSSKYIIELY